MAPLAVVEDLDVFPDRCLGISGHRAHLFRFIVPSHSGPSRPPIPAHRAQFDGPTGITGHDTGIGGHDTGMAGHDTGTVS